MNLLNLLDGFGTWLVIQMHWVGQWFEPWEKPNFPGKLADPNFDETGWYRPICSDHRPVCWEPLDRNGMSHGMDH